MRLKLRTSLLLLTLGYFPISANGASLTYCKEYNQAIRQKNLKFWVEIVEPLPLLTSSVPTVYLVYENTGTVSISVPILKRSDGVSYEILHLAKHELQDGKFIEIYESTATKTPVNMYSGCSPQMQSMIPGERIKLKLTDELHAPWSDQWNRHPATLSESEEKQLIRVHIGPFEVDKEVQPVKPKVNNMICITSEKPAKEKAVLSEDCAYLLLSEAEGTQFISITLDSYQSATALSSREMQLRSERQQIVLGWSNQLIEAKIQGNRRIDSAKSLRIRLGAKEMSLEELWRQRDPN